MRKKRMIIEETEGNTKYPEVKVIAQKNWSNYDCI